MDNEKKTFKVSIRETLERIVEVEASDELEAVQKVIDSYRREDIVLTSEDYVDTDFVIVEGDE